MVKSTMDVVEYNNIYKDDFKLSKIWLVFLVTITILLLVTLKNIVYKKYYVNKCILIEKNRLKLVVHENDIDKVIDNKYIIIKHTNYHYKVIETSVVLQNDIVLYEITLEIELKDDLAPKNSALDIKILESKQTILTYIFEKIGGYNERN